MPPASPRKSSTSSGRPRRPRPRYLGLEVAGEPLPSPASARWGPLLGEAATAAGGAPWFRVIRADAGAAIVEVEARDVAAARRAWNRAAGEGSPGLRTARSWGTLVGAKRWLARRGAPPARGDEVRTARR